MRTVGDWKLHSVKKVPGIDHSKSPLKEIVKNLFDAKLVPLSSILTRTSSAIFHLVSSQSWCCQFISSVFRDFFNGKEYWTKNLSQILHCKWNFVCGIVENVTEGLRWVDFIKNTCIWVVQCIQSGRDVMEDLLRSGQPSTSSTEVNITKEKEMVELAVCVVRGRNLIIPPLAGAASRFA